MKNFETILNDALTYYSCENQDITIDIQGKIVKIKGKVNVALFSGCETLGGFNQNFIQQTGNWLITEIGPLLIEICFFMEIELSVIQRELFRDVYVYKGRNK